MNSDKALAIHHSAFSATFTIHECAYGVIACGILAAEVGNDGHVVSERCAVVFPNRWLDECSLSSCACWTLFEVFITSIRDKLFLAGSIVEHISFAWTHCSKGATPLAVIELSEAFILGDDTVAILECSVIHTEVFIRRESQLAFIWYPVPLWMIFLFATTIIDGSHIHDEIYRFSILDSYLVTLF